MRRKKRASAPSCYSVPWVHLQDRLEFAIAAIDAALHGGHGDSPPALRQFVQYHGAGVVIGFGLLRQHLTQRKRLPLTAVFGRVFLPVLGKLFIVGTSGGIRSEVCSRSVRSSVEFD